ncbi:MAG: hypothetical protein HLX51_01390 [Micrococcaceae bacterium]|nr:hypothetical protein [Micrococcaceae bacterium]
MTKPLTSAQQKQQSNRTGDGKYTTKSHSEADVALLAPQNTQQDHYDNIAEELGHDPLDYARGNARAAMGMKFNRRDSAFDADDLAQESVLAVMERYQKDGGKNVGSVKSWLNRTMKNKMTRMGEGKFHWPNSVAIRQYNELISAREQEQGTLSSGDKDKIRHHLLDNWDDINPTMKRHRPQPDFHLYTFKNTAVRLDGLEGSEGDLGGEENIGGFLLDNASDAPDHFTDIEVHEAIQDLEEVNPKAISDSQIASAQFSYSWLTDGNAPEIKPSLDKAEFEAAFQDLNISTTGSSEKAAQAVADWEQGEDLDEETGLVKPEIAALMKPFGGEENLSMGQQQSVMNTLTRNGRDARHVNKMWTISALSARLPDQHTGVAPQKKSNKKAA